MQEPVLRAFSQGKGTLLAVQEDATKLIAKDFFNSIQSKKALEKSRRKLCSSSKNII
jgi:hypothetical protein